MQQNGTAEFTHFAFVCSVSPAGMSGFSEGEISIPAGRVHRALNRYLLSDIAIGADLSPRFGSTPRYGALGKGNMCTVS